MLAACVFIFVDSFLDNICVFEFVRLFDSVVLAPPIFEVCHQGNIEAKAAQAIRVDVFRPEYVEIFCDGILNVFIEIYV